MQASLFSSSDIFTRNSIKPFTEMAAYEAIWSSTASSFKQVADLFRTNPGKSPSELIETNEIAEVKDSLIELFSNNALLKKNFGLWLYGTADYPSQLRDAKDPIELLYYSGNLDLVNTRSVAIVGTRNPTAEGLSRTAKLAKSFVLDGFTIVSGLAQGVDTQAHKTAIESGGQTIAVIGTPLDHYYPRDNKDLQNLIAEKYLLISQVPFLKYKSQTIHGNRLFFPQRNITMSALTQATVIVEAGETSGTLIQARAALEQKRKLFILKSCFENRAITWPAKFEKLGAIKVETYADIQKALASDVHKTNPDRQPCIT